MSKIKEMNELFKEMGKEKLVVKMKTGRVDLNFVDKAENMSIEIIEGKLSMVCKGTGAEVEVDKSLFHMIGKITREEDIVFSMNYGIDSSDTLEIRRSL